jgi:hypothetical protein
MVGQAAGLRSEIVLGRSRLRVLGGLTAHANRGFERFLSVYAEQFIDELCRHCQRAYPGRQFNRGTALRRCLDQGANAVINRCASAAPVVRTLNPTESVLNSQQGDTFSLNDISPWPGVSDYLRTLSCCRRRNFGFQRSPQP